MVADALGCIPGSRRHTPCRHYGPDRGRRFPYRRPRRGHRGSGRSSRRLRLRAGMYLRPRPGRQLPLHPRAKLRDTGRHRQIQAPPPQPDKVQAVYTLLSQCFQGSLPTFHPYEPVYLPRLPCRLSSRQDNLYLMRLP